MSYECKRTEIGKQVFFNTILDSRYKTNRITVNLILPLKKETASVYALIPSLLRKGTKSCPDFSELTKKLALLYGSAIGYGVSAIGDCQVMTLSIGVIDDSYALEGEPLLRQASKILSEVVLEPALQDGLFREEDVRLEKQAQIDLIESEINEKRRYALSRAMEILCAGEPAGVGKYGEKEMVKALTAEEITAAYHTLIETARIEIMFVGGGSPDAALDTFRQAFAGIQRTPAAFEVLSVHKAADTPKEVTDRMNVAQSKLVLGFGTNTAPSDEQLNALRLMIALYGGTPSSKLFLNVREKLSLCYYCAARPNVSKGIAFVDCGVEQQNIEKAKEEILHQLDAIRAGDFTEEDLDFARLSMVNSFKSAGDSAASIEGWYLSQTLYGTRRSPEMEAEAISAVSRDAVIAAAKNMTLDTIYLLTAQEEGK